MPNRPRQLANTIGAGLDETALTALFSVVNAEVPADLLSTGGEETAVGRQVTEHLPAPGIPAAVFRDSDPGSTLSSAGLVTVTRSVDGEVTTSRGGTRPERHQKSIRRMPNSKKHLALMALRASATGENEAPSEGSPLDQLVGHWATIAAMEASLAESPRRRWIFIESSSLVVSGSSIVDHVITVDELLLLYRLAGASQSQRSQPLLEQNQTPIQLGAVFSSLCGILNRPGNQMLYKRRGGLNHTDTNGYRRYRLANDVIVSDTNLNKALTTVV